MYGRKFWRRYRKIGSLRGGSAEQSLYDVDRCRQKVREEWTEAREILHSVREAWAKPALDAALSDAGAGGAVARGDPAGDNLVFEIVGIYLAVI